MSMSRGASLILLTNPIQSASSFSFEGNNLYEDSHDCASGSGRQAEFSRYVEAISLRSIVWLMKCVTYIHPYRQPRSAIHYNMHHDLNDWIRNAPRSLIRHSE